MRMQRERVGKVADEYLRVPLGPFAQNLSPVRGGELRVGGPSAVSSLAEVNFPLKEK